MTAETVGFGWLLLAACLLVLGAGVAWHAVEFVRDWFAEARVAQAADLSASLAFVGDLRLAAENDQLRERVTQLEAKFLRLFEHNCELAEDCDLLAARLAPFLDAEAVSADFVRSSVEAVALVSALDRLDNVVPIQRGAVD